MQNDWLGGLGGCYITFHCARYTRPMIILEEIRSDRHMELPARRLFGFPPPPPPSTQVVGWLRYRVHFHERSFRAEDADLSGWLANNNNNNNCDYA